ncbi:unnamed protein product [Didymodactylos carnosus]|uniref:Uncharacterized protein n=1 Tax=Didymodactylos carnosus TaxID=1234261 RepID=A0A815GEW9_9BILA|nr:unnamed protein product [Didymodactylos carnosus]CAF1337525.1 unnamed protein product [Didymodactylos carnosus]CAF3998329.1 unnamed protein product [Didymodactylos carnosus]CAF4196079.1 unnamed protein product [Didymodactylos carnosus]
MTPSEGGNSSLVTPLEMGFYDDLFATCDYYFEKIAVKDSSYEEYDENTDEYHFIKDCQQYDKDTAVKKLYIYANRKWEWSNINMEKDEIIYELIRKRIWNEYGMKYCLNEFTFVDGDDVLQGLNVYVLKLIEDLSKTIYFGLNGAYYYYEFI